MCTTMWIVRSFLLFLALVVLIPDPGVSQIGAQIKRCSDCKYNKDKDKEDPTIFQYIIDAKGDTYVNCPHTNYIRIQLKNEKQEIICARRSLSWVTQLLTCLDGDRKCLDGASSGSQKEFSKGTDEKPSTTSIAPTTTVTTMKASTQSLDHNIGQAGEPAKPGASDGETTMPDSNKANNLHQDEDKFSEPSNVEEKDNKMKHMQTAVISLIVIVLVMVAVGVGIYCRKKKADELRGPCGSRSMSYKTAPSQESIIEGIEDKTSSDPPSS